MGPQTFAERLIRACLADLILNDSGIVQVGSGILELPSVDRTIPDSRIAEVDESTGASAAGSVEKLRMAFVHPVECHRPENIAAVHSCGTIGVQTPH